MARIIELIYTESREGDGTAADPVRMIPELWSKDGRLVAKRDNHRNEQFFFAVNLSDE